MNLQDFAIIFGSINGIPVLFLTLFIIVVNTCLRDLAHVSDVMSFAFITMASGIRIKVENYRVRHLRGSKKIQQTLCFRTRISVVLFYFILFYFG